MSQPAPPTDPKQPDLPLPSPPLAPTIPVPGRPKPPAEDEPNGGDTNPNGPTPEPSDSAAE